MPFDQPFTFIIQRIETIWTKKSRGGECARVRNAVPEVVRLPDFAVSSRFLLHRVRYAEPDFQQIEAVEQDNDFSALKLRDLELLLADEEATVRFIRDGYNAAKPAVKQWRDVFTLKADEWGQVRYNGRYVYWDTGNWWYQKDVYNIAWTNSINKVDFTKHPPDHRFSEMVYLR